MREKTLSILGCRGVPAAHGGFETFADHFSRLLVQRGWQVTVYCQESGHKSGQDALREDEWCGVRRVIVPVSGDGAWSTIVFDGRCTLHALREPSLKLVLGYNTALFSLLYRLTGQVSVMNMDGIEWRRAKWSAGARSWLYLNDWFGCLLSNHLIADHPSIADHLASRVARSKISTIPYGAEVPVPTDDAILRKIGVERGGYALCIARPEPENSVLEIVRAFSRRPRDQKLVVLGRLHPEVSTYHRDIVAAAGPNVVFAGAIYDAPTLAALRSYALLYVHGHQVGGTNPSLVEALAAGLPVLAHDNRFNRWVAAAAALYFSSEETCASAMDQIFSDPSRRTDMARAARARHRESFTWDSVCNQYEDLLDSFLPSSLSMSKGSLAR